MEEEINELEGIKQIPCSNCTGFRLQLLGFKSMEDNTILLLLCQECCKVQCFETSGTLIDDDSKRPADYIS